MLRIHFTSEDLLHTRLAVDACPRVETTLSLGVLQDRRPEATARLWRAGLRGRLDPRTRTLMDLVHPVMPEFLDPAGSGHDRREAADRIASTSRSVLHGYLDDLSRHRRLSHGARSLGDGDRRQLRELGETLCTYHDTAIAPHWATVQARVEADRLERGRILLDHGVERILTTLHPAVTWIAPVLHVRLKGNHDLDVSLGGRGLLLQPVVFTGGEPSIWDWDDLDKTPVLAYPARCAGPQDIVSATARRPVEAIEALLGRTRAAILAFLADRHATTGELARGTRTSNATASEHATVLRAAGLITSVRNGKTVLHAPDTPRRSPPRNIAPGHTTTERFSAVIASGLL